jgi:hypothetical protein
MRRTGHIERMGKSERQAEVWWGNLKERHQVEDQGIYKTIQIWISNRLRGSGID